MSSLVVEVCEIESIRPHSNQEITELECAKIKGWQVVVRKGKYKPGQLVVYVPPDSVMPLSLSDSWGITKYLAANGRVTQTKIRGEFSFGCILDADPTWEVGKDVSEYFGITKYEPPTKLVPGDTASVPFPKTLFSYTDIENIKNHPYEISSEELVCATEKIHGTNVGIVYYNGEFYCRSKGYYRKECTAEGGRSLYWAPFFTPGVRQLLEGASDLFSSSAIALFGEIYGSPVIGKYTYDTEKGKVGFRAFDLYIDGNFVDYQDFKNITSEFSVPIVPSLCENMKFDYDYFYSLAQGKSVLTDSHICEGIVVRPMKERLDRKGNRVIYKVFNESFKAQKNNIDYKDE